jgi:neutral ceramidase
VTGQVFLTGRFVNGYNNITNMSSSDSTRQLPGSFFSPAPAATCFGEQGFVVGAATCDVTPRESVFLYGYPHQPRYSTGINDPLLASALYLSAGGNSVVFVSVDIIWLSKGFVRDARSRIAEECGVRPERIMISATHTHSGPVTVPILSNADDLVVPPPDANYLQSLADGVVSAVTIAIHGAEPAEIALVEAECPEIGGNRHDRRGPTVSEIPILAARSRREPQRWLGLMYLNRVHPTVLHEDSLAISSDFPGMCREYLQSTILGAGCPILSPLGAAGNQSPRFAARAHTLEESRRLGSLLGKSIESALQHGHFRADYTIECTSSSIDLSPRSLPTVDVAMSTLDEARQHFRQLCENDAKHGAVRTAECAVFGAEENVTLAKAATSGELTRVQAECLPAEIQLVRIGPWMFVGWPGEVFAEFALELKQSHPNAHVVSLSNGELQGYLVTETAVRDQTYEACNAIFESPAGGNALVSATMALIAKQVDGGRLLIEESRTGATT